MPVGGKELSTAHTTTTREKFSPSLEEKEEAEGKDIGYKHFWLREGAGRGRGS